MRKGKSVGTGRFRRRRLFCAVKTTQALGKMPPDIKLAVLNVDQIKLTSQKSKQKEYKTRGLPGSLKFTPIERAIEKKGKAFVFVDGCLGNVAEKSKLQIKMIKNLILK